MKNKLTKFTIRSATMVFGLISALPGFAQQVDTWNESASANWSAAANWTFSSGSAVNPSGDFLIFSVDNATFGATLNNDLSGYSFAGITFTNGATAYTFGGNPFGLAGGITNSSASAQIINNNFTLAGNQSVTATSGALTLGGVIDDGGNGYGLTFPGAKNVTLTSPNTYSGPTTVFGGGTLVLTGSGCVSNSSIVLGKTGLSTGAFFTMGGTTLPAGTTIIASNLIADASILGGQNFNNWNNSGTSAGNLTEQFTGALMLNTGLLRSGVGPNSAGNLQILFNSFSRSPGTVFSLDRATIPGANTIASLTANSINLVFNNPPALIGSGAAGTTTMGVLPGITLGTSGIATYDSTYGLRTLTAVEHAVFASGLTPVSQNAYVNGSLTVTANTEVNSLYINGSYTVNLSGVNTLTVDSGVIENTVNGAIGASVNDGFLALGAEGIFDVAQARTLTINSVITGTQGLTVNIDNLNNNNGNVVLAGANTYTGKTRVLSNGGQTLHINNSLALQDSTLDYNNYGGTITFGSPTSFTFGGLQGAQNLAVAVPLTLGGDGDSTTYSGVLSGAGSIIKTGSGAFTLAGANTYSGGTTLSAGQLNLNNGGTSSANSSIGTAALTITGGTIDNTSGSPVTLLPNNAENWNGSFTFNGSSSLNIGTGFVTLGGNEQVTVNANTLTVGGAISGTGDSLSKNGNGTLALAGANTYSGNTIISGGTLKLTGSAGIASSPNIIVSNAAVLDVSGLSSTFTLGGSQSLYGSGTNNGSVGTSSGSQIYADVGSTYGTNTFNNSLTLASGAAANFQLGTVANGSNDLIVVTGNLTLNGNSIKISAPSPSVSLGTSDYTLFTVVGTISGSFAATPTWIIQPANFGNYSIVTSGNTVKLHYQAAVLPSATGYASPSSANRGQNTTLTVIVTPGTYPIGNVTVNATPIGGASAVSLVQSNSTSVYTNTVTVGVGTPAGSTPLTATISDTQANTATVSIAFAVNPGFVIWNGGSITDNNWSDTANWVGGLSPFGGDAVTFAGTARLAPSMDSSFTLSSLTFSNNAGSFVITSTPASLLTLNGIGVTNNSVNAEALNVPIALGSPQTFAAASGNITLGGVVSGSSLTEVGNNLLTLSGTNTYGGGTLVKAGTLVVANNSALGSGALTLAGGSVSNSAGVSYSVPNNVTVTSTGNVGVGSGDAFTLSGTVSGAATLTKVGNGALVLPNANNISGGVTVSAGTLVVANNSAVGSGLLTLGNASISNSAGTSYTVANTVNLSGTANVLVESGDTFTLSGLITNVGGLNLSGSGTLSIPGLNANTYSGNTVLNAGTTLNIGNTSISPLGSGTLTFAGGTLADGGSAPVTLSNNITVVTNTTTFLNPTTFNGNGLTLAGNITGPGNIVVNGSGSTFDSFVLGGSNSAFSGTLTVNQGGDQRFAFGSPTAGSPNAAFVLNSLGTDNQKFIFGTGTISLGSLAGVGTLRNDGGASVTTLRIGDLNASTMFNGQIVANGSAQFGVLKVGSGTLSMTNNEPYTGPTEVAGGELLISEVQGASTYYQVDDGATLGVVNFPASGLFAQAPILTVGTTNGGSLLFTNVDLENNGIFDVTRFTNNGTCTVIITDTNNLAVGVEYPLVEYATYGSTGAGNFVLSGPPGLQGYVTNDLSVPQLALVVTGFSSLATNPTNILVSTSGNNLSLTWPGDHLGWYLQAQTNSLSKGLGTNWVDVPGSSSVTNEIITMDPSQPAVFYRMSINP